MDASFPLAWATPFPYAADSSVKVARRVCQADQPSHWSELISSMQQPSFEAAMADKLIKLDVDPQLPTPESVSAPVLDEVLPDYDEYLRSTYLNIQAGTATLTQQLNCGNESLEHVETALNPKPEQMPKAFPNL